MNLRLALESFGLKLLRELVDIDSVTFREGVVGQVIASVLSSRGWKVEVTQVAGCESNLRPRQNVYAGIRGKAPKVVFSTHMDTVPPHFGFSEDEFFVYGRGVCDAKGIMVAEIIAAEALRECGFDIGLLFLVGEESGSDGAKIANQAPKGSLFLINGEPTCNKLATATKGTLRVHFTAKSSKSILSAQTHNLIIALQRLMELILPIDPILGSSTINIGRVMGGCALDERYPDILSMTSPEAEILIRTTSDTVSIKSAIIDAVSDLVEVRFISERPPISLLTLAGYPTIVANFATDIPFLNNWGAPILLGPGSIHDAHTEQECLSKRELLEAINIYIRLAKSLLSSVG